VMRNRALAAVIGAAALTAAAAIFMVTGGDDQGKGTTPSATKPPVANTANAVPGESIDVFGRLIIPRPKTWDGTMGEPDVVIAFADTTTGCSDAASCPHVYFVNYASSGADEAYGPDPVKHWSAQECTGGTPGKVEGPTEVNYGGQAAQMYKQVCGDDATIGPRYAWYFKDKQLFVALSDIGGSPEILEGALEGATWQ
jgi:hypothetical protein